MFGLSLAQLALVAGGVVVGSTLMVMVSVPAGIAVLFLGAILGLGRSRTVDRLIGRFVRWGLRRWTGDELSDYVDLLHLRSDFAVASFRVEEADWLAGRTLEQARLQAEGVLCLGLECPNGAWIGAPPADVEIRVGDLVVLYGARSVLAELPTRTPGADGEARHDERVRSRSGSLTSERLAAGR